MKTYIIQLDEYDDILSARDKMNWSKGERILLVWPARNLSLSRRLDLTLLKRHSRSMGAELGLVSTDPEVNFQARQLGIPIFKSVKRAQVHTWRRRRFGRYRVLPLFFPGQDERPPWNEALRPRPAPELSLARRLLFFGLGVLSVLAIAATLAPEARIQLTPQAQVQDVVMDVRADPAATEPSLTGRIPAAWTTITVEGRAKAPATGQTMLPDRAARGEVQLTNLTENEVEIPAGTIVRSGGSPAKRFAVIHPGSVPASPGQTVNLAVQALAPGTQGNLPAGALNSIEGLLGARVTSTNLKATHSGTDRQEPTPSSQDRRHLFDDLQRSLQQTALQELHNRLSPQDILIGSSVVLSETLQEEYLPSAGLPSDQVGLHLQIEYRALVIAAEALDRLASDIFTANLPPGFEPLPSTLHWEALTEPIADSDGSYVFSFHAYRHIAAQISTSQVVRPILGLRPDRAVQRLQATIPLEGTPHITLSPDGWPFLPILPFRITVILAPTGAETAISALP